MTHVSKIFESVLRQYGGGEVRIRRGLIEGLSGELVVHDDGEFIIVRTKDRSTGAWNPAPEQILGTIYTEDEITAWATRLVAVSGIGATTIEEVIKAQQAKVRIELEQALLQVFNRCQEIGTANRIEAEAIKEYDAIEPSPEKPKPSARAPRRQRRG